MEEQHYQLLDGKAVSAQMKKEMAEEVAQIKAAGGISTVEDIEKFLDLGADRLGTSRAVKLLTSGEAGSGY